MGHVVQKVVRLECNLLYCYVLYLIPKVHPKGLAGHLSDMSVSRVFFDRDGKAISSGALKEEPSSKLLKHKSYQPIERKGLSTHYHRPRS